MQRWHQTLLRPPRCPRRSWGELCSHSRTSVPSSGACDSGCVLVGSQFSDSEESTISMSEPWTPTSVCVGCGCPAVANHYLLYFTGISEKVVLPTPFHKVSNDSLVHPSLTRSQRWQSHKRRSGGGAVQSCVSRPMCPLKTGMVRARSPVEPPSCSLSKNLQYSPTRGKPPIHRLLAVTPVCKYAAG